MSIALADKPRVVEIENPVPDITADMGRSWRQPKASGLTFYEDIGKRECYVVMSKQDREKLQHYAWGFPSGVYDGKMWRCDNHLVWFEASVTDVNCCVNKAAEIFLT